MMHRWGPELVLSFHHVGPGDQTLVPRLGGKLLCTLSQLQSPPPRSVMWSYCPGQHYQMKPNVFRWWWHTLLIPALRRQRQEDLCESEASLVYRVSFRTARAVTQRNLS